MDSSVWFAAVVARDRDNARAKSILSKTIGHVTTNHVLGVELVLPSGEVVRLGGAVEERHGYDLVGLVVGSEGTFGIVTRATLKLR